MSEKKIVRRGSGPFVISGNRLRHGRVVWLTAAQTWSARLNEAAVLKTAAHAEAAMAQAGLDRRELAVVDVHVVDVVAGPGQVSPVTYRERIRAFGPTIAFGAQLAGDVSP